MTKKANTVSGTGSIGDALGDIDETIARARGRLRGVAPTVGQWAAALTKSKGLRAIAARSLGASYVSLQAALAESAELREIDAELREHLLDHAEKTLWSKAIEDRDGECLRYLLKTVGKARGYGEKVQHDLNITDGAAALTKLKAKLGVGEE